MQYLLFHNNIYSNIWENGILKPFAKSRLCRLNTLRRWNQIFYHPFQWHENAISIFRKLMIGCFYEMDVVRLGDSAKNIWCDI